MYILNKKKLVDLLWKDLCELVGKAELLKEMAYRAIRNLRLFGGKRRRTLAIISE